MGSQEAFGSKQSKSIGMNKLLVLSSYDVLNTIKVGELLSNRGLLSMGVGVAVAGAISLLTMITVIVSTFAVTESIESQTSAKTEMHKILDDLKKSNLTISSISASAGDNFANFTLSNTGSKKQWDFEKFDVVIRYDADIASVSTPIIEEFSYEVNSSFLGSQVGPIKCTTNSNFEQREWIIGSIQTDVLDPKILNSNEIARICAQLSNSIFTNGDVTIAISSDIGAFTNRSSTVT